MSLISLKAELRQQMKLSPQILQSMEILQMNSQELLDYLGKLVEENPLLEQEDAYALRSDYEALRQKASWIDGGVYGPAFAHGEGEPPERGAVDRNLESLTAFLWDQLERRRLPKPLLALSRYLAELVDEDGYLAAEDVDSLRELNIPEALICQAVETLQGLDPAGVGARDLAECLRLQLSRQKLALPGALDIAARFLPDLGKKHYSFIARELGLSLAEVRAAEKAIAALDPHPGRAFQAAEPAVYVRPDVFIVELDGELTAVLNEYYLPKVSINGYYARLLKDCGEKETRDYLRQKMQQAKWLLNSLDRRGSTLRRCADAILEVQRTFFAGETGELAPMSLLSLSQMLELHPSTISRATRDKYLQCRQGVYPLRYFFNRAVGGSQGASRQAVKQKLLAIVREEDPRCPLSDQCLCRMLEADGIYVARRTVAKYRMELGIGSAVVRKR